MGSTTKVVRKGGEKSPLIPLCIRTESNTGIEPVRENIKANLCSGVPSLKIVPEHERVLHIVGSGPSAIDSLPALAQKGEHEDVMALNGAYRWLRGQGITPTFFAMLDAREVNINFLDDPSPLTDHFFASQAHPSVVQAAPNASLFHLLSEGTEDLTFAVPFWLGAGVTIGLVALGLANALGYRRVVCHGYDSSFTNGAGHVRYQEQNANPELMEVWIGEKPYITTGAMAAQVSSFVPIVQMLQKQSPNFVVEVTGHGLLPDWVREHHIPADARQAELDKYIVQYENEHYHMMDDLKTVAGDILSEAVIGNSSYLDVGCGRGETLDMAVERGFQYVHGTETVPDLIASRPNVTRGVLPHLPTGDNAYDVVTCFEVIEHLLPEDVEPAIKELYRVAGKSLYMSAACFPAIAGGTNLHPSARPAEEWDSLLDKMGLPWKRVGVTKIGSPVYKIAKE